MTITRDRPGRLDIVIGAVALVLTTLYMAIQVPDEVVRATWVAVPLFALCAIPMFWRRVAPLAASAATFAAVGLHVAVFQDDVIRCGVMLPISLVLGFAVGARLELRESLAGLALNLGTAALVCLSDHPTGANFEAFYAFIGPILLGCWAVGRLVHSRGRMVRELETRTGELRVARDERARLEVRDDRARLSAELDGLLQTRLGALARLADDGAAADQAQATAALERIEHESRDTLRQMRAVVGVLRDDTAAPETAPQPALTQLDGLLVRAKGAGARLTVEGRPRPLPPGVELSAYRVVEHLLDAVQDEPEVRVTVRFQDDALELRVTGAMRRRGATAIEKARERARLHHGDVALTTDGARAEALVSLPIYATV